MIGIYFSGTGNTKYCLEKFVALYDRNIEITPLEDEGTIEKVKHHKRQKQCLSWKSVYDKRGTYLKKWCKISKGIINSQKQYNPPATEYLHFTQEK